MSDDLTDSWPPRWKPGVHFKKPIVLKVQRHAKTTARAGRERTQKDICRDRDKYCRFPLCGCGKFKLPLEASHQQHKGMGGNPKEDRSTADKLITLCRARHQTLAIAVGKGTLKIKPLTKAGTAGPCAFYVDMVRMISDNMGARPRWFEIARETARHAFEPFTPEQLHLLKQLATMKLL